MNSNRRKVTTETLSMTNLDVYPYVTRCFHGLLATPVSMASTEISFSIMRRIRSTLGTERLLGLGLLNIHREREISSEHSSDVYLPERTCVALVPSINECMGHKEPVSILVFGTIHTVFTFHFFMMDRVI